MFSGQFHEKWVSVRERSTKINVAENTTNVTAIEPQKLHHCNR